MDETRGPTFATGYEHLTLVQRLQRIVYSPRSALQAIGDEPTPADWVLPIVILAVIWVGANYLTLSVLANPELPAYVEKLQELTPEQQERTRVGLEQYLDFGWYMSPIVNSFFSLAAVGLVLLGVARIVFRADVSLRHMLTVKGYASVIAMIELVARTPLVLSAQTRKSRSALAVCFPMSWPPPLSAAFSRVPICSFSAGDRTRHGPGYHRSHSAESQRTRRRHSVGSVDHIGALLSSIVPPPPAAG